VLKSDRIYDKNAKDIEIAHKYTTKKDTCIQAPFEPTVPPLRH
jgi:hypothetical protein